MILNDAKEEAQGRIEIAVTEFMPTEGEAADFDASGLAKWARETYACELETDLVRAGDRDAVRAAIEAAASARFDAIDMGPVKSFLVEDFSVRELVTWTERILGVQLDATRFAGIDGPEHAAELLVTEARKAYAERERTYGVDFAIEFTAAQMQGGNPEALAQFCRWAQTRYGLDWNPSALPSNDPRELRRLLVEAAAGWDQARFTARAAECLASGRQPAQVAAWFEAQGLARLAERELEDAAADPEAFVSGRLREVHRAELTHFERWVLLQTLDNAWKDHLRAMDQIRDAIGFRAFSQKDPRIEFKKEAARLYDEMLQGVRDRVAEVAFKGRLVPQAQPRPQAAPGGEIPSADPQPNAAQQAALAAGDQAGAAPTATDPARRPPPAAVGRNEPCPCGSGKKFKHCHGMKEPEAKA
jgi:preprotein translocase subunit SecA